MYIRKVTYNKARTELTYTEYRLVESVRDTQGKVKQRLLLHLGKTFPLPEAKWSLLTQRIGELLSGQISLFPPEPEVELLAQKYAKALSSKEKEIHEVPAKGNYVEVDPLATETRWIRSIGGEYVVYSTLRELEFNQVLESLGFNKVQREAVIGCITGRLLKPSSEHALLTWLKEMSALEELLGTSFQKLSNNRLYRVCDQLYHHRKAIEAFLYQREKEWFGLRNMIVLYDLTNTYLEGSSKYNEKGKFGHSKEKRTDCPLMTMGLVLDGDGFVRRSEIFPGNVSESKTLATVLETLKGVEENPIVVLDAGVVSEVNLQWLRDHGYHYVVVSRNKKGKMPEEGIITVKEEGNCRVRVVKEIKGEELYLYCHSTAKEHTEQSMQTRASQRYEEALLKLKQGLSKKKGTKQTGKIEHKLGRLHERHRWVAHRYDVRMITDENQKMVIDLVWEKKPTVTEKGVYCLRTDHQTLGEEELWKIHVRLTEVEEAFRCMKSELGLRPIYHQKTRRVESHLFLTILSYHVWKCLSYRLKAKGITVQLNTLRDILNNHGRVTTVLKCRDGKRLHVRTTSQAEPRHQEIYQALSLSFEPLPPIQKLFQ